MNKSKNVTFKGMEYTIKILSRPAANEYIVKHHYTHAPSVSVLNLGVFRDNALIGVISYGQSVAPKMHTALISYLQKDEYFELLRLHVKDVTPKHFESWFISESFKWIKEFYPKVKILVSFADPSEGHNGTIYQATNWHYVGKTSKAKFYRNIKTGKLVHPRTYLKWVQAGKWDLIKDHVPEIRHGKYRYVYFLSKTYTFYKDLDTNNLVPEETAQYLLQLEQYYQRDLIEKYNGHLKKYNKYLIKDLKREILPYPK